MTRSRIVQVIYLIVVNRGPYSSRLGSTWYYAQQTVMSLQDMLSKIEEGSLQQILDAVMDDPFDVELDKLFGDDDSSGM